MHVMRAPDRRGRAAKGRTPPLAARSPRRGCSRSRKLASGVSTRNHTPHPNSIGCKSQNALGMRPCVRQNRVGPLFHRWLEYRTGRFSKRDPRDVDRFPAAWDALSLLDASLDHSYAYVGASPVTFIDPTGMARQRPDGEDGEAWNKKCKNSDPLSPEDPQACKYGNLRAKPPGGLGVLFDWEINCVCKCMPDSPSANCVRGCIQCAHDNGADVTRVEPHVWCRNNCQNDGKWGFDDGKQLNKCIWEECCTPWFQRNFK
jgi:hypothetical protein